MSSQIQHLDCSRRYEPPTSPGRLPPQNWLNCAQAPPARLSSAQMAIWSTPTAGWKARALTNSSSPGMCGAHRGDVDGAAGVARRDVHCRAGARAGDAAGAAVRGAATSSEARQEFQQVIGADGAVAVDVGGAAGGLLGRDLRVSTGWRGLVGGEMYGVGVSVRPFEQRPANAVPSRMAPAPTWTEGCPHSGVVRAKRQGRVTRLGATTSAAATMRNIAEGGPL